MKMLYKREKSEKVLIVKFFYVNIKLQHYTVYIKCIHITNTRAYIYIYIHNIVHDKIIN